MGYLELQSTLSSNCSKEKITKKNQSKGIYFKKNQQKFVTTTFYKQLVFAALILISLPQFVCCIFA
jgi:hypothetical protein